MGIDVLKHGRVGEPKWRVLSCDADFTCLTWNVAAASLSLKRLDSVEEGNTSDHGLVEVSNAQSSSSSSSNNNNNNDNYDNNNNNNDNNNDNYDNNNNNRNNNTNTTTTTTTTTTNNNNNNSNTEEREKDKGKRRDTKSTGGRKSFRSSLKHSWKHFRGGRNIDFCDIDRIAIDGSTEVFTSAIKNGKVGAGINTQGGFLLVSIILKKGKERTGGKKYDGKESLDLEVCDPKVHEFLVRGLNLVLG